MNEPIVQPRVEQIDADKSKMATMQVRPDIYAPRWNGATFVDHEMDFPTARGIQCQCTCRGTIFKTKTRFKQHCRSKSHRLYLDRLQARDTNPLRKIAELEETIRIQQMLIHRQEIEINQLLRQRQVHHVPVEDLLQLN